MRTILFFILISSLFLAPFGNLQAESAGSVLKDLKQKYDNIESMQVDFSEIFVWVMTGEKVQRNGKLIVSHDNKFKFDTSDQLVICDGETVFRYNRKKNQVLLESVGASTEQMLPQRLMLQFAKEFNAVGLTSLPVAGRSGARLDLEPKKPEELMILDATIWITSDDQTVHRIKFSDLNGNTTTYLFSNIEIDAPLSDSAWSFETPEDAEIFDLRQ